MGMEPKQFLRDAPETTIFLIIVMVWIQTGFAMVVLSAAIKGVPTELVEAARLDGANPWQQFRNVTIPGIRGALVVVLTVGTQMIVGFLTGFPQPPPISNLNEQMLQMAPFLKPLCRHYTFANETLYRIGYNSGIWLPRTDRQ